MVLSAPTCAFLIDKLWNQSTTVQLPQMVTGTKVLLCMEGNPTVICADNQGIAHRMIPLCDDCKCVVRRGNPLFGA